jgi:threonine/homoserine/homoserine lactone efflux protein
MQLNLDKDTALDALGAACIAYAAWVMLFKGEPIPVIGDFLKYFGTGAIGYMAWKLLRKN